MPLFGGLPSKPKNWEDTQDQLQGSFILSGQGMPLDPPGGTGKALPARETSGISAYPAATETSC